MNDEIKYKFDIFSKLTANQANLVAMEKIIQFRLATEEEGELDPLSNSICYPVGTYIISRTGHVYPTFEGFSLGWLPSCSLRDIRLCEKWIISDREKWRKYGHYLRKIIVIDNNLNIDFANSAHLSAQEKLFALFCACLTEEDWKELKNKYTTKHTEGQEIA